MTFSEFKKKCETSKRFDNLTGTQKEQYKKEIYRAGIFYDNGRNLYQEFLDKKDKIQKQYILPYLLEFTDEVIDGERNLIQVKPGASGGIDVDTDVASFGREKIYNYLVEKYSKEQVIYVGAFSSLGPASAAKDLLRVYGVDFAESNEFTKVLEKEMSWEENIDMIKAFFPNQWKFYNKYKEVLDLVPHFINKIRQTSRHAGGMVILPDPVYNYIPVERVGGEITSAFPENGSDQVLDEIGITKYDILGISILDVISNCVDMIDEELYLIEEDGVTKVVAESYLNKELEKF